jgi:hypothetical protein
LKVIHEFACWLCGTWGHVSQSPLFSVAAVCCFFCDFFRHTVDIQTTQISVDKQQGKHITPPRLQDLSKASTCSSLIRRGSFQGVLRRFVGRWVGT